MAGLALKRTRRPRCDISNRECCLAGLLARRIAPGARAGASGAEQLTRCASAIQTKAVEILSHARNPSAGGHLRGLGAQSNNLPKPSNLITRKFVSRNTQRKEVPSVRVG